MSIREKAEELNISAHTLKNWLRRDNLPLKALEFPPEDKRLTRRANKKTFPGTYNPPGASPQEKKSQGPHFSD